MLTITGAHLVCLKRFAFIYFNHCCCYLESLCIIWRYETKICTSSILKRFSLGVPPRESMFRMIICLWFYPNLHDHSWYQNGQCNDLIDVQIVLTSLFPFFYLNERSCIKIYSRFNLKINQARILSLFYFYNFHCWFFSEKSNNFLSLPSH